MYFGVVSAFIGSISSLLLAKKYSTSSRSSVISFLIALIMFAILFVSFLFGCRFYNIPYTHNLINLLVVNP